MRKPKNLKEHLQKIKYHANYNYIKEAYISEVEDEDYDEIPDELFEDEDTPEEDNQLGDVTPEEDAGEDIGDTNVDIQTEPEEDLTPEPQASKDELQTQALRAQIEAMQKMSQKIDSLENVIKNMGGKVSELNADVEEVKEPEPIEKFNQRKKDSHPFYYGLNDMWNGNVFQSKREELGEDGIIKLEDGSYIADFDDLPQYSSHEIKSSF